VNHELVSTMVLPTLDLDMDRFLKRLIAGNPAPPEPTLGTIAQMREAASRLRLSWANSANITIYADISRPIPGAPPHETHATIYRPHHEAVSR
jgi:hypothetical protein